MRASLFYVAVVVVTAFALPVRRVAKPMEPAESALLAAESQVTTRGSPQPDSFCKAANDLGAYQDPDTATAGYLALPDPLPSDVTVDPLPTEWATAEWAEASTLPRKAYAIIKGFAESHQPAFNALGGNLATAMSALTTKPVQFSTSPLKALPRSWQKVADKAKYKGNWCKLTDVVRGSLILDSVEDLAAVAGDNFKPFLKILKSVCPACGIVPGSVKNRFKTPVIGYRDIMMLIFTGTDLYQAEIQIHIDEMIQSKKGGGHKLYRAHRVLVKKNNEDDENIYLEAVDALLALDNEDLAMGIWNSLEEDKDFLDKLEAVEAGTVEVETLADDMEAHYDTAWTTYISNGGPARASTKDIVEAAEYTGGVSYACDGSESYHLCSSAPSDAPSCCCQASLIVKCSPKAILDQTCHAAPAPGIKPKSCHTSYNAV